MNYAELVQRVQDYLETDEPELVANIPTFVRLTEQKVFNATQLPEIRANVTGQLTPNNPYLTLPAGFLFSFSLAVVLSGRYEYLINKDVNFVREAFPDPAAAGVPQYYAMFDSNTFILGPAPDTGYTAELHYARYPDSIVDNGTSWLGDNFDTVLLYGALLEANIFQKGEADLQQLYQQRFEEAFLLLKTLADGKLRRDAYRAGQTRVNVA